MFLRAGRRAFGLSKAAAVFDAQKQKSRWAGAEEHHHYSLCSCQHVFVFLLCRVDQGSQASWGQRGCRYVPCERQCLPSLAWCQSPTGVPPRAQCPGNCSFSWPKRRRSLSAFGAANHCNCVFTGEDGGDGGDRSTWLSSKCPSLVLPFITSVSLKSISSES